MKANGILLLTVLTLAGCRHLRSDTATLPAGWLPTGVVLDPAAPMFDAGPLPLEMVRAPEGDRYVLLLSGWSAQGVQVVDPTAMEVTQTLLQPAAFVGVCFSRDGRTLFASGGDHDVVYRYTWANGRAALADSIVLAPRKPRAHGTRYPAGLAVSPDGQRLYVAENLADSLAVVDLTSGRVTQHLATGRYPYEVAVAQDGTVYVSAWGASHVAVFSAGSNGRLVSGDVIPVGYHPSALLLSRDGGRLFVTSSSTDEIRVIDTATRETVAALHDPAPAGPHEGSTPNALALSPEGTRLFVAEADNNAVAVFDLSPVGSGIGSATGRDQLVGRIPVGWYPTALAASGDTLLVANGKGLGTGPNVDGPQPDGRPHSDKDYTLGQLSGTVSVFAGVHATDGTLASLGQRVQRANNWTREVQKRSLPPFKHVIYIIKENRTYDQVFGDMPGGDGDTSLLYFPRAVTPNHHALAERFGLFDRFFVNAEVSAQGHNWSMAAYSSEYVEKTVQSNYSGRGRTYDYEGENRGEEPEDDDDAAAPANGYMWDLANRKGITFRNYGEFVAPDAEDGSLQMEYKGLKPFLKAHTNPDFPGFDLDISDQHRVDVWLQEFRQFERSGELPQFEIVRLPNDHTKGASAGALSPRSYLADNDLALGRMIDAITHSPFWKDTAVFVLEDDAQNGPDHVDSHRSVMLVISPYNRPGAIHRIANTTDALATMEAILGLDALSQFDYYARPLTDIFADTPDLTPYSVLTPAVPLDEHLSMNVRGAEESSQLDFTKEDVADEAVFNRVLWELIKGPDVPYPGTRRASMLDMAVPGY